MHKFCVNFDHDVFKYNYRIGSSMTYENLIFSIEFEFLKVLQLIKEMFNCFSSCQITKKWQFWKATTAEKYLYRCLHMLKLYRTLHIFCTAENAELSRMYKWESLLRFISFKIILMLRSVFFCKKVLLCHIATEDKCDGHNPNAHWMIW